jgi:CelD/BcsL family acetyltransferase involved in cellulose biosynthesis
MSWQLVPAHAYAAHAAAWDALQRQCTDTPFLESGFLAPLLQHFGSGREQLALHHSGGRLDAAALLQPGSASVGAMWQTFQPSQLPLGPWLAAPDADLPALTQSLVTALPGLALGLGLTQLDPRLLPRPADAPGLRSQDYIRTSWVDVQGRWDGYWEARGKNLRQNLRKAHNKLAAEGLALRLDTVTDPAEVPAALAQYGALESAGWKAEGGTAIHPDNAQGRFYTAMLQHFCAAGRGRIVRAWLGDSVAAMDLCIDNGPLVVILKTAYDERHKAVSPSVLMRHDEFKAWWEEGRYQRIEFYGKTLEWHTRWTAQERVLYHATRYRWPLLRSLHEKLRGLRAPAAEASPANSATTAA